MVHLRPESMFELLFPLLQRAHLLIIIEKGEHAHDSREAMHLQHVEKLECLELKAVASIDGQQHEIRDFGAVNHTVHIITALDELEAPSLPGDNCHGPTNVRYALSCVMFDERHDESALAGLYE